MGALSSHDLHVIRNKQAVLFLRALQHGINTDESTRSANSSTGEIITALIKKITLEEMKSMGTFVWNSCFLGVNCPLTVKAIRSEPGKVI